MPEISGDSGEKVHVAVGKSLEKTVGLIQWTSKRFGNREICLVHVHQPSPLIPTLLGKLPASQASAEVVAAYRKAERELKRKHLLHYLDICRKTQVKASIITIEADHVPKGIIELVNRHCIRKLVMGAVLENWMKVKTSPSKVDYTAKHAPSFCEIWFINKGKVMWTREASESASFLPPENLAEIRNWVQNNHAVLIEETPLSDSFSPPSSSNSSGYISLADRSASIDSDLRVDEESLCSQLEAKIEAEDLRNEVFAESLKRRKDAAAQALNKVKAFESAHAHELKLLKETEELLKTTLQEQEEILEKRKEMTRELQRTTRNSALLNIRVQEANCRQVEATGELRLIQASTSALRIEKKKLLRQKREAVCWLERWKSGDCLAEDPSDLKELTLSELQNATGNFSENFIIGQGGYGCVYKGYMFGRTVAIKKLHTRYMQIHWQSEFHKQVQILARLQHPNLVTVIGACPEDWAVVHEYMPNGNLEDRLFRKNNTKSLTWMNRTRVVAQISSALFFLHTSKPEKIIHGALKPENLLFDSEESELICKLSDFGCTRLVPEKTFYCPSFRRTTEPKGAFPFTDPEFNRTLKLTPKSDVYSFGLIILVLLTGKPPAGLPGEVRRAVSCGRLVSILDSTAGDWPTFVARRLVDLGLQCCELSGKDRPELTPSLVKELDRLHLSEERQVPSFFVCPITREIMYDPQVAADGFTYEGEAMRDWLEKGRETSPMTNLTLDHLYLTPNHALRQAIQEWLCKF